MKFIIVLIFLFVYSFTFSQISVVNQSAQNPIISPLKPEAQTTDLEINRVISIVNTVEDKNNLIDQLNPDSNVSLPFGIVKQLGAARYVIAIDSLNFQPQGAYFSAYACIDFPGTTKKLAFRGSHLKFNPKGVVSGDQSKLYLVSKHIIHINATVSLMLLGNGQNWVEWDCNGFKAINLNGNFIFRKGKLLPDPTQTNDSVVTASFQIRTENIHDFITNVNITPFKITGLEDWGFRVANAIVDMSELSNSNSMVFPPGYVNPNNLTPQMWTGFSLQSLLIKLPSEISKTAKRTEIEAKNLLIDNMGLTGVFQVNNLFSTKEGSMNGWDFSINELGVGFICNKLSSGHLKGTLNIPIMDSASTLQYTGDINYNPVTKGVDYCFSIKPESNLRFKVFSANVDLNSNSQISVTKINGYFKPTANLSGRISFDSPKLNSNGGQLAFQNLEITTEAPYVTNGIFTLHNINGGYTRTNFYPVSIEEITFGVNHKAPALGFNVKFNLSELINNSLTVGTSILIKGKIESRQETYPGLPPITFIKTKWGFDKVVVNGVRVDLETSPFTLKGNIFFNDNHPVYGDGFFGLLDLSLKKVIEDPIGINAGFGSKENYRYFFLDAKVPAKYIIPSTPIGLSRLIGGVYYHMKPNKLSESELISLHQNFNNVNENALIYVPNKNVALGLKMGVTANYIFNESVFNGEFLLDVNFTNSGGLGSVNLNGNVYSMAKISNKVNGPIKGRMAIIFDPDSKTFDALAQVNMSAYQIITGQGYFKLHFDPQVWYACIGKPSAPNNINILNLVNIPSYFMTGNTIEPARDLPSDLMGGRDQNQLQNGGGFCAGARITSSLSAGVNLGLFGVSGAYSFNLGFDLMMANYGEKATCRGTEDKIGMNGLLAQGNMYLDMYGSVKINGHYKFPSDCPHTYQVCTDCCGCCCKVTIKCMIDENFTYTVLSGQAKAIVYAQLPKPFYFNGELDYNYDILGRVKGGLKFNFDYGKYCNPVSN